MPSQSTEAALQRVSMPSEVIAPSQRLRAALRRVRPRCARGIVIASILGVGLLVALLPAAAVVARRMSGTSASLTVTPITWSVVGLDSNAPAAGPKNFPIGMRVCSALATANVSVVWAWDSANANVNLRPGSLSTISIANIAAGSCADAYFEVEVTQTAVAFDTTRRYHVIATDASGNASSPTPREIYVEHLISQNRNGITAVKLNGVSVPAGGTMNLLVGNTYAIELDGYTATQGYNQFEEFINFPNTIFQVLSVSTTYTADSNTANPTIPQVLALQIFMQPRRCLICTTPIVHK